MQEIMKKHEAGSLPKSCYADDGHIYMNELLKNGNPNNAMNRGKIKEKKAKDKAREITQKMEEERKYLLKHPELKHKQQYQK